MSAWTTLVCLLFASCKYYPSVQTSQHFFFKLKLNFCHDVEKYFTTKNENKNCLGTLVSNVMEHNLRRPTPTQK